MVNASKQIKWQLREQMLAQRKLLSDEQKRLWDQQIVGALLEHPWYQNALMIMVYLAMPSEIDLGAFIDSASAKGRQVCVPRVNRQTKMMDACGLTAESELVPGVFGILEPAKEAPIVPLSEIDLIVMPGLAFTPAGDRIGYGGGYYDRFLVGRKDHTRLLGVAYDFQVVPEFPVFDYDQKIHGLVTPTRVLWTEGQA